MNLSHSPRCASATTEPSAPSISTISSISNSSQVNALQGSSGRGQTVDEFDETVDVEKHTAIFDLCTCKPFAPSISATTMNAFAGDSMFGDRRFDHQRDVAAGNLQEPQAADFIAGQNTARIRQDKAAQIDDGHTACAEQCVMQPGRLVCAVPDFSAVQTKSRRHDSVGGQRAS